MEVGDEFHDLLAGVELLQDSSRVSITSADANNEVRESEACDQPSVDVLHKIEAVFEGIANSMMTRESEVAITLRRRTEQSKVSLQSSDETTHNKRICFPGNTEEEAWRFTVVLRILELTHEALRNGIVLSKRDIYYRDPALFGKQSHVDRYVDEIAFTFGVQRSKLNITAVAKGIVAGAFNICRRDGSVVEAAKDREGMLVPSLKQILSVDMTAVKWILVIEKEATFRSIAASNFWEVSSSQGVILTAKGYPDIASRALLHFLSTASPQNGFAAPPVYILVDLDPDGLAIHSVFKNGSLKQSHDNTDFRLPQLEWLGLRREHMAIGADVHVDQGLLNLTARDRRKAVKMLERCTTSGNEDGIQLRLALQEMLMLNNKAELQMLDAIPGGMNELLVSELGGL